MSVRHRLRLLAFPMRTTMATCRWSDLGSPGSRARSMRACQVLRPRRVAQVLALALLDILPSTTQTASAPGISFLSRLDGWPVRSPADASPTSSRMPAHGSGPMWFATPSSQWTSTTYSLPVSRRTLFTAYWVGSDQEMRRSVGEAGKPCLGSTQPRADEPSLIRG